MSIKKQTARNNEFLRQCKVCFNTKIYSSCIKYVNTFSEEKAREYLKQFFKCEVEQIYQRITQ